MVAQISRPGLYLSLDNGSTHGFKKRITKGGLPALPDVGGPGRDVLCDNAALVS